MNVPQNIVPPGATYQVGSRSLAETGKTTEKIETGRNPPEPVPTKWIGVNKSNQLKDGSHPQMASSASLPVIAAQV